MKYRTVIRPEAEEDLKESFSWYEDQEARIRARLSFAD